MPSYLGKPTRLELPGASVTLFRLKGSDTPLQNNRVYYRLSLTGVERRFEGSDTLMSIMASYHGGPRKVPYLHHNRYKFEPGQDVTHLPSDPILWPAIQAYVMRVYMKVKARQDTGIAIPTKKVLFSQVVRDWIKVLEEQHKHGERSDGELRNRKSFLNLYVLTFRGFDREPSEITEDVMVEWGRHRDAYWITGDGSQDDNAKMMRGRLSKPFTMSTKNKHRLYLNEAFNYAKKLELVTGTPEHNIKRSPVSPSVTHPLIADDGWKLLEAAAPEWIESNRYKVDKRHRQLVWYMAVVIRAYGLRVLEANGLQFNHVFEEVLEGVNEVMLSIPPLGGPRKAHPRSIEPIPRFSAQARQVLMTDLPAWFESKYGRPPRPEDPLFHRNSETPSDDNAKHFETLLNKVGLIRDRNGDKRSLTSLRHSAITELIETSTYGAGVIARWAGTSITMLDKHYNQALTSRAMKGERARLRGLSAG